MLLRGPAVELLTGDQQVSERLSATGAAIPTAVDARELRCELFASDTSATDHASWAESKDSPSISALQEDLSSLEGRDFHLWSIALLVALVLAAGICSLLAPRVIWHAGELRMESPYLPQVFFGFIALIALFNAYVFEQRRMLRRLREELTRQLVRANIAESVAQIDPLTDTLNRRWMKVMLQREISRTERLGSNLTVVMVDVDDFKAVNTRLGHVAGDRLLQDVARMLKRTFRASDAIVRFGGDEFLVVMSDTAETQAAVALERLESNVARWNERTEVPGWTLHLSCGYCAYDLGMTTEELLAAADARMYANKNQQAVK